MSENLINELCSSEEMYSNKRELIIVVSSAVCSMDDGDGVYFNVKYAYTDDDGVHH